MDVLGVNIIWILNTCMESENDLSQMDNQEQSQNRGASTGTPNLQRDSAVHQVDCN